MNMYLKCLLYSFSKDVAEDCSGLPSFAACLGWQRTAAKIITALRCNTSPCGYGSKLNHQKTADFSP